MKNTLLLRKIIESINRAGFDLYFDKMYRRFNLVSKNEKLNNPQIFKIKNEEMLKGL